MGKMNKVRKHFLYLMIVLLSVISLITIAFADSKERAVHIGELVQGDPFGIKVIMAEATNEFKDLHGKVSPYQPDHKLIMLEVKFYVGQNPAKDKDKEEEELRKLSMIDANGRIFPSPITESSNVVFRGILRGKNPQEAYEKEGFTFKIFFSVPKESSGFRLQYRNLPQVSLGL